MCNSEIQWKECKIIGIYILRLQNSKQQLIKWINNLFYEMATEIADAYSNNPNNFMHKMTNTGTLHEKWVLCRRSDNWKGPFSQGYFQIIYPLFDGSKEKSELKFIPLFPQNKDIFRNFTPFLCENKEKPGLKFTPFFKSNQIKLKSNIFILNQCGPNYTMR